MKKTLHRCLAFWLCLLTILALTSCTKPITETDAFARLQDAVKKSKETEIYYYLKTEFADKTSGKLQRTTEVNLWAVTEETSSTPVLKDGAYQNYKLSIKGTEKGAELWSWLCGDSSSADGGVSQSVLFYTDWRKERTPGLASYERNSKPYLVKREEHLSDFLKSEVYAPYSLSAQLTELSLLTADDMDFSVPSAKTTVLGELVKLVFGVRKEYLAKYKAEHGGAPSIFEGSAHVEIDLTYGRVQKIALFVPSNVGVFKSPKETLRWEIFYLGSRFDIPKYDVADANNAANDWKDAPVLAGAPVGF
ncbi:MAG: hypothetical protein LBJ12_00320 [Oscillospiraceae bacterium]|jgi:hypothetical protein|nr:hypothetical protein [Oscillospiraceae bacterium]